MSASHFKYSLSGGSSHYNKKALSEDRPSNSGSGPSNGRGNDDSDSDEDRRLEDIEELDQERMA